MRSKAATSREVEFLVPEEPCEVANSLGHRLAIASEPPPIDKERKSRRAAAEPVWVSFR
jgi:hypothetical protein